MLKFKIDFPSFLKQGIKSKNEDFEVSLITGYMGSGKTYLGVYKSEEKKRKVFTNIKSYKSNLDISYFSSKNELLSNYESDLLVLVDECSKWFPKDSKIDKDFYEWLQHSRKLNRYVLLIFQEYYMVPNWIRGVANHVYTTRKIPLLNICLTSYGIPLLDETTKEWGIQELMILVYKRNKSIAELYDTYELHT